MPKIERTCQQCGKVFCRYPAYIKKWGGKHCSNECAYKSRKGRKQSPEIIEKRRISLTGRITSDETKRKISEANKGRKLTKEHKQKLRIAKLGKKQSVEHKAKIKKAISGENNYNWMGGHERNMEQQRVKRREGIKTLKGRYADYHIKNSIRRDANRKLDGIKISSKDIPPELVELKRAQLKITREIRKCQEK
ncbi:MAG: NUMOD3 domain-containing DNA-binding protein [Bacteroidales bacterium]